MRLAQQAGDIDPPDGVAPVEIGAAERSDHHAAAGVVSRRGRSWGSASPGQRSKPRVSSAVDHREVLGDELRRLVADVQVHAVGAQALHFMVDGAGDDIAQGQFAARVEIQYKAAAVRAFQVSPFAAQRFGQQEVARLRDGTGRSGGTG